MSEDLTTFRVRMFETNPSQPGTKSIEGEAFGVEARDDDHAREVIRARLESQGLMVRSVSALASDKTGADYAVTYQKKA